MKCVVCESLKGLISKSGNNSNEALKYEVKLKKHVLHQKSCKNLYYIQRIELVQSKDEFLCIIHENMDHAKIVLSRLQVCNKMIFRLGQLPITLMSMIAHGHRDERFAHYFNELWPNNPNFIIGSLLRLLQTLEVALILKSKLLFEHPLQNSFFARMLQRKLCYICELCTSDQTVGAKPLLRNLLLQMDDCVKDNKNQHLLAFLSLLTARDVFEEVKLGLFVVGHTCEDIDGCFGYLSKKLMEENNYILANLMRTFMIS